MASPPGLLLLSALYIRLDSDSSYSSVSAVACNIPGQLTSQLEKRHHSIISDQFMKLPLKDVCPT